MSNHHFPTLHQNQSPPKMEFINLCLEWFLPICIGLCFISAILSNNLKLSFTILINICLFKIIYILDFSLFKDSNYYLLAIVIDTITMVLCHRYKSSKFVLLLLSLAIILNSASFFLYELSTKYLLIHQFYAKYVYIYYESSMKMIIIMLVLYNFKDGLLHGIFERKYNINTHTHTHTHLHTPKHTHTPIHT